MKDEVVAQGCDVQECLYHDVHVRVGANVVEADEAGPICLFLQGVARQGACIELPEKLWREGGREQGADVVQRRVVDFVQVRQDVDLRREGTRSKSAYEKDRTCAWTLGTRRSLNPP